MLWIIINGIAAVLFDNGRAIYIDWSKDETVDISSVIVQNNFVNKVISTADIIQEEDHVPMIGTIFLDDVTI